MGVLFYLLLTGCLFIFFVYASIITILLVLAGLPLIGLVVSPSSAAFQNLTNPLLLEFAGGIVVASQADRLSGVPT